MEKCKIYEQLRDEAETCGCPNARIRDVAFAILNHVLRSPSIAYAVIFPNEKGGAKEFAKSPMQKALSKRIKALLETSRPKEEPAPKQQAKSPDEITADQNRAEIMRSIQRLEAMKEEITDLSPKDLIAIEKQLLQSRTALKEKFEVSASAEEQLVIVQPKFNHICEQTGRECWLQTKEYAMEHWGLVEP